MLRPRDGEALLNGAPVLIQTLLQGKDLGSLAGTDQVDQRGTVILCNQVQISDSVPGLNTIRVTETALFDQGALVDICLYIRDRVIRFLVNLVCCPGVLVNPGGLV